MGLFGFGKSRSGIKKKSPLDIIDLKMVTGCLYYLQYNIKSLRINVAGKKEDYACKISEINEKKEFIYLTVLGRATIGKSDEVELTFDIAEIRYTFKTVSKKHGTEHDLCLEYPLMVSHFERRKYPRAVFRRNENIDIKLVTDIFSGYGAVGRIHNISAGGFQCAIVKVVKVDSGKDVAASPHTFKPPTMFAIVQFNLPGYGRMELSGRSIHVSQSGYNLNVGGNFAKLSGAPKVLLDKFLAVRSYNPIPPDFLAFHKKYEEDKIKAQEEKKKGKAADDTEKGDSGERDYSKASSEEEESIKREGEEDYDLAREDDTDIYSKQSDEFYEEGAESDRPNNEAPARDESILVVLLDADETNIVKGVLKSKGFVKHTVVNNYAEALKLMTQDKYNLILIDFDLDGQITSEQFISTLKKHPTLRDIPIAIFLDSIDVSKQAKIIGLKISRMSLRPIKELDIIETLTKVLGE